MGPKIDNVITNERVIPGLWIVLIKFATIKVEKITTIAINNGGGPLYLLYDPDIKAIIISSSIGRVMKRVTPY